MTKGEALKLALEALETVRHKIDSYQVNVCDDVDEAITAIREALREHAMYEVQRLGQEIQPEQTYRRGDRLLCLETDEYCVIHISGTDRQWVKFPDTHIGVYTNEQVSELFEKLAKETDLAQPEQEPVAWMYQDKSTHEVRFQKHMRDFVDHSKTSEVPLYSEPLANHELQCVCGAVWCGDEMVHLPNKTTPPHRKPLTDEEIEEVERWVEFKEEGSGRIPVGKLVRYIEAKLKEKNT